MSSATIEIPIGIAIPDTADDLINIWKTQSEAMLLLYTGNGGPKTSQQENWTPIIGGKNWRGKLVEGSALLDRKGCPLPKASGECVERTFGWHVDRVIPNGIFWVQIRHQSAWDRMAFNLYPTGPKMYPGDQLIWRVRFVGT